jgi:hypothetical protein
MNSSPKHKVSLLLLLLFISIYAKLPSRPIDNNCIQVFDEIFFWTVHNHSLHVTAYVEHYGSAALGFYNSKEIYLLAGFTNGSHQEWSMQGI